MEVGELLLKLPEILHEEGFIQATGTIEEVELTVGAMQRLRHVHDLRAERSHTCSSTNPNHLLLRVEMGMEISIRTTHHYLVAGLQTEDVT